MHHIRLLTSLAALFHDLGKTNVFFQRKLLSPKNIADPFRHEWVSLRLFQAFVGGDVDAAWLERMAAFADKGYDAPAWLEHVVKDTPVYDLKSSKPFESLPPLARDVAWIMATHHRLPVSGAPKAIKNKALYCDFSGAFTHAWFGSRLDLYGDKDITKNWTFKEPLPLASKAWRDRAAQVAQQALACESLRENTLRGDTYVLHVSRLALVLADQHYSSLSDPCERVKGDANYVARANTIKDNVTGKKIPNQTLDEHLLGVEKNCGRILRTLPRLEQLLPRLAKHKGFARRSKDKRFQWQDTAYDLAVSLREQSAGQGFFGVNMASTGCGKTLGNGRVLYALASPEQGARFTMALGLRALTLQTGEAYGKIMKLKPDVLATLVGGGAVRELYELGNTEKDADKEPNRTQGTHELLSDEVYVHYEGSVDSGPLGAWLRAKRGALDLVNAPVLACTIDHLMPATECLRGGRHIPPMLRLMTSDLILDEPDDFDVSDMHALSRLVNWAGMLGTRVLLSSATLPPAIVTGLFKAYQAGRAVYQQHRGTAGAEAKICCAWFDEFGCQAGEHGLGDTYATQHAQWVEQRVRQLQKAEVKRRARIVPMPESGSNKEELRGLLAERIRSYALELHGNHHSTDPVTGARVSFGLVRMANIDPLIDITRALCALEPPKGCRVHVCCYHSRHPLLLRSEIEKHLDTVLDRRVPDKVFTLPAIRRQLDDNSPGNLPPARDHIFLICASPVAEVGRDHDYDWAIVEPSSMRSIIQLAGRVRRHRPGKCTEPNIYLLSTNLKSFDPYKDGSAYKYPGFETKICKLASHDLSELIPPQSTRDQFIINATPRIVESTHPSPEMNLADLEHARLRSVMLGQSQRTLAVNWWWQTNAAHAGELQRATRFRNNPLHSETYVLRYDEFEEQSTFQRFEKNFKLTPVESLIERVALQCAHGVCTWPVVDYDHHLLELARRLDMAPGACSQKFGRVDLEANEETTGWLYHPALGFRRNR